ncbi:MAG TPA: hypothetical protein VFL92_06305 [Sphingomonas sp.]|nr:hypothetical protein [Sphingomonas sp.]
MIDYHGSKHALLDDVCNGLAKAVLDGGGALDQPIFVSFPDPPPIEPAE